MCFSNCTTAARNRKLGHKTGNGTNDQSWKEELKQRSSCWLIISVKISLGRRNVKIRHVVFVFTCSVQSQSAMKHTQTHTQKHEDTLKGSFLQAGCLNQTLELVRGPTAGWIIPPSLILSLQLISWCWLSGARTLIALIFMTIISTWSTAHWIFMLLARASWIPVCSQCVCVCVFDLAAS